MQTGLYLIVSRNKNFSNPSHTQLNQNLYYLILCLLFKSITPNVLLSLRMIIYISYILLNYRVCILVIDWIP